MKSMCIRAKTTAELVFPAINEERLAVFYSDHSAFRTNTPINISIDLMLNEVFYNRKSEDVVGRLDQTIADTLALLEIMADDQWQADMTEYNYDVGTEVH